MGFISIHLARSHKEIQVPRGSNLMKALLDAGVPVASSCGGDGICGKCHLQIVEGIDHLSTETENELFLKEKNNIHRFHRISCQTQVYDNITIDAPYW